MTDDQLIDWQSIWRQIELDEGTRREEATREQLRQRARQYAAPLAAVEDSATLQSVLAFDLGAEQYAVDVMLVQAVRILPRITPVPGTSRFYRGVVNLRGQIISVIDLRIFFDIPVDENNPPGELVMMRANNLEIGLLAHHVHGVMTIPNSEIQPMPEVRYARGVTANRLVLLDIAALFEDERLIIGGTDE
jgi:purine-binding chemotaxis protein CheW